MLAEVQPGRPGGERAVRTSTSTSTRERSETVTIDGSRDRTSQLDQLSETHHRIMRSRFGRCSTSSPRIYVQESVRRKTTRSRPRPPIFNPVWRLLNSLDLSGLRLLRF